MFCEKPDGRKHGPYGAWHDNGRKEEEGTYSEGHMVGRWREWDAEGKLLLDVTYAVPFEICVFDEVSRRSVLHSVVTLRGIDVIANREVAIHQSSGALRVSDLPAGRYEVVSWPFSRLGHRPPQEVLVTADAGASRPIMIPVDATSLSQSILGAPSRCAQTP